MALLDKPRFKNVLEIGAGTGASLIYMLENKMAETVNGIDLTEIKDSFQQDPRIQNFWLGDIEKDDFNIPAESFDCIFCGDILEHLIDPWTTMALIQKWLKPGGTFILSIPNIREIYTFSQIYLKGSFKYNPEGGILDKTHLRFFCRKDAKELVETSGLKVLDIYSNFQTEHLKGWRTYFNKITFRLFEEFLTIQHFVLAKKI